MENIEKITLAGIILTFLVSVASLILSIINWKKASYVKSVTDLRAKWLANLKDDISEYCGIAYGYSSAQKDTDFYNSTYYLEGLKKFDKLRYLIPLNLNHTDNFDKIIIGKVQNIPNLTDRKNNEEIKDEIEAIIKLCQQRVKHDWEVVKLEARKGRLNECDLEELKNKYL